MRFAETESDRGTGVSDADQPTGDDEPVGQRGRGGRQAARRPLRLGARARRRPRCRRGRPGRPDCGRRPRRQRAHRDGRAGLPLLPDLPGRARVCATSPPRSARTSRWRPRRCCRPRPALLATEVPDEPGRAPRPRGAHRPRRRPDEPDERADRVRLTCGIDVGGTKIAGGVVDEDGTILEELRVRVAGHATSRRSRTPSRVWSPSWRRATRSRRSASARPASSTRPARR